MILRNSFLAVLCGLFLLAVQSCNFSSQELKQMAKSQQGKDYFRDSEKWGKVVTRSLDLSGFSSIYASGHADVKLTQGESFSVEVTGNEKGIDCYDIKVVNTSNNQSSLYIALKEKSAKLSETPSIQVAIVMPDIEDIEISGLGDFEMKNTFEIDHDCNIEISGMSEFSSKDLRCKNLNIDISGIGDVKIKKIVSDNVYFSQSGQSQVSADIKADNIHLDICGAGSSKLNVKCKNIYTDVSGIGSVSLKGECNTLHKGSSGLSSLDTRNLSVSKSIDIK